MRFETMDRWRVWHMHFLHESCEVVGCLSICTRGIERLLFMVLGMGGSEGGSREEMCVQAATLCKLLWLWHSVDLYVDWIVGFHGYNVERLWRQVCDPRELESRRLQREVNWDISGRSFLSWLQGVKSWD